MKETEVCFQPGDECHAAKQELKEVRAQLADITFELDQLLTQFNAQYEKAYAANKAGWALVTEGGYPPKEQMNWNSWFMHELKQAIRHAGYKKKERARG